MNLLEINHVEKAFDGLGVLKDISLTVGEGEIVSPYSEVTGTFCRVP